MKKEEIIKYLKNSISENEGNYNYSLPIETTKATIKCIKEQSEEIERLNNIINGMEKFFEYAYDNEARPLNDRKVSVWTICLDILQELKGCDKE